MPKEQVSAHQQHVSGRASVCPRARARARVRRGIVAMRK